MFVIVRTNLAAASPTRVLYVECLQGFLPMSRRLWRPTYYIPWQFALYSSLLLMTPECLKVIIQNCRMNQIHCGASYRVISFDTVQTLRLELETHVCLSVCLSVTADIHPHTHSVVPYNKRCYVATHTVSWFLPLFARQVASAWSYVCWRTVTRYVSDPVIHTMYKSGVTVFLRTLTYEWHY